MSVPAMAAVCRMDSSANAGSSSGAGPTTTTTLAVACQPRVEARDSTVSSVSPRNTASTTRASSRSSQAPRSSAARAYTSAAEKATSRLYWMIAACRIGRSALGITSSIWLSTTSMVVRTSSTVWYREIRRASSRGAEPKMSAVLGARGSGEENHLTNPSMPAWATRVIHDRCSASNRRNQWCRDSISATATVVIAPVTPASRLAMLTRVLADGIRDLLIPRVVATIG